MTTSDFLSCSELGAMGLGRCGRDVCVSRRALILAPEFVEIGDFSRVDAFSIISGSNKGVSIGARVHVSAYVSILGAGRTEIEDYCTVSARCSLFTSNDDYSGIGSTNPTVPKETRLVAEGPITLKRHSILGCGTIILPNVVIGASAAVGALTLVKVSVDDFAIVAGNPMRRIGTRHRDHLAKEIPSPA